MEIISKRLKALRESVGLSQNKLAQISGMKQSSINRYENGSTTPSPENMVKLADYYDVSLDYIYGIPAIIDKDMTAFTMTRLTGIKKSRSAQSCKRRNSPAIRRLKTTTEDSLKAGKRQAEWLRLSLATTTSMISI